jgi:hypothetical protein
MEMMVFILRWNLFVFLAGGLKHWLRAGDDAEQNHYYGENEQDMDETTHCCASHKSQQPQDQQHHCNRV